MNNVAGVYNSYLLHYYSRIDDRFPALCLLIKHWAKANNIGDASVSIFYIQLFKNTLLIITHQHCRPAHSTAIRSFCSSSTLCKLQSNRLSCPISKNAFRNCSTKIDLWINVLYSKTWRNDIQVILYKSSSWYPSFNMFDLDPSKNTCSPGELLIAFFDYYAAFDFDNWAISIANARVFPRHELIANTERFKIFIEEPFDKNNTARCVTTLINFELIQTSIQNARNWFLAKRRPDIKNLGVQDCFNLERQGLV